MKIGNTHCRTSNNDVWFMCKGYSITLANEGLSNKSKLYYLKKKIQNGKVEIPKWDHKSILIWLCDDNSIKIEKL